MKTVCQVVQKFNSVKFPTKQFKVCNCPKKFCKFDLKYIDKSTVKYINLPKQNKSNGESQKCRH